MKRTRAERGFTLLELLITLSITTIGLIGLLSLHLSVTRGNDNASRSAEAQQIGASHLESLRAQRPSAMMKTLNGNPLATPPQTAPEITVVGRAGMTYRVVRSVTALTAVSGGLWKIRVVTSWTDDGAEPGANGGLLDHSLALEVVRTVEEAL